MGGRLFDNQTGPIVLQKRAMFLAFLKHAEVKDPPKPSLGRGTLESTNE